MTSSLLNRIYVAGLLLLVAVSVYTAFTRYLITEDFRYFTTTDEIPERFDFNGYGL